MPATDAMLLYALSLPVWDLIANPRKKIECSASSEVDKTRALQLSIQTQAWRLSAPPWSAAMKDHHAELHATKDERFRFDCIKILHFATL